MIIETERAMAMRCPACGKLNHQVFSLFAFSGSRSVRLQCTCGFSLFTLSTRDHSQYTLQMFCVVCELPHMYTLTAGELFSDECIELACTETGTDLGLFGSKTTVQDAVRKEQTPLADLLASHEHTDYFENREVMTALLKWVQRLADQGRLFCHCGNTAVDIDIFPERVELHCPECDGALTVYGRTVDDLRILSSIDQIELVTKTIPLKDRSRSKTRK